MKKLNLMQRAILSLERNGRLDRLSDTAYLKLMYRVNMGKRLRLKDPQTYSEKIQWLKLYDRDPRYTMMVDKYRVREYIAETIGEEYLIPSLGVWESPDEIDFDALPERFVLKCNHNSGLGMYICKDKSQMDVERVKEKLRAGLAQNYYLQGREWQYKNVKPCIVAEQYMEDEETKELRDYKFFAFDGEVKALFIASERGSETEETKFDFFDADFNHLPFLNGHPNAAVLPKKPQNFELMKQLASKLSRGIPQVRVDFYEANGRVYFGELTFWDTSGCHHFDPIEWDETLGSWIELPEKYK